MLMRRLLELKGSFLSKSTVDERPTTRSTLFSSMPPAIISRREALARLAESSQLEKPFSPPTNCAASVWPEKLTLFGTALSARPISRRITLEYGFSSALLVSNIGRFCSSMIWMRNPSVVTSINS